MAAFLITPPSPPAATIAIPGQVTLNFEVSGNDPCHVKLSYHLNSGNNVYFEEGGTFKKEIVKTFDLTNPPLLITENLKLVKRGTKPNFSMCYVYIDGIDTDNNDPDNQIFVVHFS